MENGVLLIFGPNMPQKCNLGSKFLKSGTEFETSTLKLGYLLIFMENEALLIFGPNMTLKGYKFNPKE